MRKLKKLAIVCSMALLALTCMLGATACDNILAGGDRDSDVTICTEHNMQRTVDQEATCTDNGEATLTCETCGFSQKETISALGHYLNDVAAKEATCTEDGWSRHKVCERPGCDYEQNKLVYPAFGHDEAFENADSKPASCQQGAFCGTCKSVYTEPLNHELVLIQEAARRVSCTSDGWDTYFHCGYVDETTGEACPYTTQIVQKALGHDGERDVDGDGRVDEFVNRFSEAATCFKKAYCGICNKEYGADPSHQKPTATNNSRAATCDTAAYCAVCDMEYGEPLGHIINQFPAQLPSCEVEGWYAYESCARPECSYNTKKTVAPLGHHEVPIYAIEPTCTTPGYTEGAQCDRCLDFLSQPQFKPALGHDGQRVGQNYGDFINNGSFYADCTTQGYCAICEQFYGEVAIGYHVTIEIIDAKDPTCTETGWYAYEKCLVCGYSTYKDNVRLAFGHQYEYVARLEPTCTEIGYEEGSYCVHCQEIPVIEALGHDVDCTRNAASKPINCEDQAFCGDCGEYYGDVPGGKHYSLNEATCMEYQVCEICGVEYGEKEHWIRPDGSCYYCSKTQEELEADAAKKDEE